MIAVEQLSKRYGRQTAVDDVSFTCEPGTVTGLIRIARNAGLDVRRTSDNAVELRTE